MGTFTLKFSRNSADLNKYQGAGPSEPAKFRQRITTPCKRLAKRCIHSIKKKRKSPAPKSFLGPTDLREQFLLVTTPPPIKQPQSQAIPHEISPVEYNSNSCGLAAVGNGTIDRGKQRNEDSYVAWEEVQSVLESARKSVSSTGHAEPLLPEDVERQKEQAIRMINDLAKQQKSLIIQRIELEAKLDTAYERTKCWKAEHDRIKRQFEELQSSIRMESAKATDTNNDTSENQPAGVQESTQEQVTQPDNQEDQQIQEDTLDNDKQLADEPEQEQENYQALLSAYHQLHIRKEQLEAHLHYLLKKGSYYDQVYHDAQSAWETREEMEQQLMKQAGQFWHMRNIYSQYLRRIEQLRVGGFDMEAEIAEKLAYQAECKWARRELAALKTELKRAKREKQIATRGRILKARLPRASRFNMWPIRAELHAYRVLTDSLKNEQRRLAQRFRDSLETTTMQNRNDELLQAVSRNFSQELDRNEELEKERLERRHPDCRMYCWNILRVPPGVQVS